MSSIRDSPLLVAPEVAALLLKCFIFVGVVILLLCVGHFLLVDLKQKTITVDIIEKAHKDGLRI